MEATQIRPGLIERMRALNGQFWFTLIRVIIVVALVGEAMRLVSTAYAPQAPVLSQEVICPPDVATRAEAVVSPPAVAVTDQPVPIAAAVAASTVATGDGLANTADVRSLVAKKEERRSTARKPPTYAFARNSVLPKRAAIPELAKRGAIAANHQQKWKAPVPTLARSSISPSPFSIMHGQ